MTWKGGAAGIAAMVLLLGVGATARAQVTIPSEYGKTIKSAEVVGALGENLFGEQTNFYTGATSFFVTDVRIPGNGALDVSVGRRFVVEDRGDLKTPGLFADWELEIPHLHGTFARKSSSDIGWQVTEHQKPYQRCNVASDLTGAPPDAPAQQGGIFGAGEFWHGNNLYVPGAGDQEMLVVSPDNQHRPTDGKTYRWVTQNQWFFSCLPRTANGLPGEAFLAIAPDGTRYRFDWAARRPARSVTKATAGGPMDFSVDVGVSPMISTSAILQREEVRFFPTRIEDRFGNFVTYAYDVAHPGRLQSISASDGRVLTLAYDATGRVASVFDGARTWRYTYDATTGVLARVTLPDATKWTYALFDLGRAQVIQRGPGSQGESLRCEIPSSASTQPTYSGTLTHPSGATGTFVFKPTLHGRAHVPRQCIRPGGMSTPSDYALHPYLFDTIALQSKSIGGLGIATPYRWTYAYGPTNHSWSETCATTTCATTKTIVATESSGTWRRYTFGNRYQHDEGKLLKVETGTGSANILRVETTAHQLDAAGQRYPARIGRSPHTRGDRSAERQTPVREKVIDQDGARFRWGVDTCGAVMCFDAFARPTRVTRSQKQARTDLLEYEDNRSRWVIGLPRKSTSLVGGAALVEYEHVYDANALPARSLAFGKLVHKATYHADGTLATVSDGRDSPTQDTTIAYSNWKRGIPQRVAYPDATTRTAVVDDLGRIQSATDETGAKTCYAYDAMGRLNKITHPSESQAGVCDTSAWAATTITFSGGHPAAYGVPAGHWRQTTQTGGGRKLLIFDALWRPVVEQTLDVANIADTTSEIVRRYDEQGRVVFESYPMRTAGAVMYSNHALKGKRTTYDVLGRVTRVEEDAEADAGGVLVSTTEYLANFTTRTTNPRGKATVTAYKAYDQPTTDWPIEIAHPDGVYTDIARDSFGKPTIITRSDASVQTSRTYTYNSAQELCRVVEPETGATLSGYDAAGNLAWSASGLPASTACDPEGDTAAILARKVSRAYDQRNRIRQLTFADGRGNASYAYTPDNLQHILTVDNGDGNIVTTTYEYNRRRLLTKEQMRWNAIAWPVTYGYDNNGHLASQGFPGNLTVDYAPNALGQATKAGTYATGVRYHPNGAIAGFTYGNGIVHSLTQNARQLPLHSRDAYGSTAIPLDHTYGYDANGNVEKIVDGTDATRTRAMVYDNLDRLTQMTSPGMLGGTGKIFYRYDGLDNIVSVSSPNRSQRYCYDANNRLAFLRAGATVPCPTGAAMVAFGYDVQGNLANKNNVKFNFDLGNRLRSTTGGVSSSYVYDALGRRVRDYTTASKYSLYTQSGQLAYVSDGRSGKAYNFVYLGGSLVAERSLATGTTNYTVKYQHTDALGTPVAISTASRQITKSEYEPYGRVLNRAVQDGPGFTGHVEDAATGLTYMQQRYYDALCGCFLSVDPVTAYDNGDMRFFNRYAYAFNNPYKFTDPDGRAAHIAIGGGVGALFGGGMELYRQLSADGKVTSWTNVGIETAKGAAVGALTAAVPGAALTFGGTMAKAAVSIGNAAAVGAAGEVAAQVAKGEAIDAGKAMNAGVANGAGVAGGMLAAPLAKAMATTTVPGNPGFQVTSLRGQTFTVNAIPDSTTASEGMKQAVQDVAGGIVSSLEAQRQK